MRSVGLSLSGMVGIWLAAHAPERLSALVLCSTSAYYDDHGPWVERAASVRWVGTSGIAPEVVAGWINTPTLVIAGSQDPGTPTTPHAKTLGSAIYRAKLEVLDGTHLAVIEHADRAHRVIAKHVAATCYPTPTGPTGPASPRSHPMT
ncbi:MAG: alpha/beta fold hydrolase [Pseudonocardiaceae bacterium]